MKTRHILLGLLIGLLVSCTQKALVPFEKNPNCQTTLEGRYLTSQIYSGATPALFMEESNEAVVKQGAIIEVTETGVHFDPGREGPLFDPDPVFVENDEILALIDENGNLLMGALPAKFSSAYTTELIFRKINDPSEKNYRLKLDPGPAFSFCMEPGVYQLAQILFHDRHNNIDRVPNPPLLEMEIFPGRANYIGDLYLNADLQHPEISLNLDYVMEYRAAAVSAGGAIGGALAAVAMAAQGVIGSHLLETSHDEAFVPSAPLPIKHTPLKLK